MAFFITATKCCHSVLDNVFQTLSITYIPVGVRGSGAVDNKE